MKNITRAVSAIVGLSMALSAYAAAPTDLDGAKTPNGKVAVDYMNETFNGAGPQEAFKKFFAPNIANHGYLGSPRMQGNAPGGESANNAASGHPPAPVGGPPEKRSMEIKKVIVQGDLVFVQGLGVRGAKSELQWELFRIKDGKIIEVWTTHNEIPADQIDKQF